MSIVAEADWEGVKPERLFGIGADYLEWARTAEGTIREKVTTSCLNNYNEVWADEDPEEGPPRLDHAGFLSHLRLNGISLYHDGSANWFYDASDLFAGHGIMVWVSTDRAFEDASLIG